MARVGDHVYFRAASGPSSGKVICHGKHGATVEDIAGRRHKVKWTEVLGHKSKVQPAMKVLDQGVDGAIVEDEDGKRAYLHGLDVTKGDPDPNPADDQGWDRLSKAMPQQSDARPMLIDLSGLSCGCTDHAMETIHKALGDPPDDSLWAPHHDAWVSDHIEDVTRRGLDILDGILGTLQAWMGLEPMHKAESIPWRRRSVADIDQTMHALGGKKPEDYTLDDWLMVVDWLLERYLPPGVIQTEAEYLAVRAVFSGRIQANMRPEPGPGIRTALVSALPVTNGEARAIARMTPVQSAVLDFSIMRAGELITEIGESTRHRIRQILIDHEEGSILGRAEASQWGLQSRLLDEFSILNRDWRRIAISEVARDANEGFLSAMAPGSRVKRVEAYNACPFCKSIHGMVFNLVEPGKPDKDGWKDVWVGKTNVGRSASPRKRVGDELVERSEEERYWPAAGIQHPNCRGTWASMPKSVPGADPEFVAWLDDQIAAMAPGAPA